VNKVTADIREAAQEYTQDALDVLVAVMKNTETPAAARVSAASAVLDRGHGKPMQSVEVEATVEGTLTEIRRTIVDPRN